MSGCQGCPVKVTEDDDQNVRHGEGEEIVVHGAVEPRALDDHQDDGQVAQQPRDEDDHVEYCHRPQKSLAKEWEYEFYLWELLSSISCSNLSLRQKRAHQKKKYEEGITQYNINNNNKPAWKPPL